LPGPSEAVLAPFREGSRPRERCQGTGFARLYILANGRQLGDLNILSLRFQVDF
jgi:hypothetical protein